jgi:thioredoxin 1|tara:strand:- start:334 stop:597 length:264 start_codon:yes stop_codon:yes gene_type:complete
MIPEKGKYLVNFSANWCGPCKAMKVTLEKFKEFSKDTLIKINVDTESDIAAKYGVRSIPCFIVVKDGNEIKREVGSKSLDQLKEMIK